MKKLEEQLLLHSNVIYESALSCSNGNQDIALKKIYYAVNEVAGSFRNFANKDNALSYLLVLLENKDIPYKKILLPSKDVEELIVLTLDQYQKKKKKRNKICIVAFLSFILLIGLGWIASRFGNDPHPPIVSEESNNGIVMNNATIIAGDTTDSELRNYHNLTSELGAKAKFGVFVDRMKFVDYF